MSSMGAATTAKLKVAAREALDSVAKGALGNGKVAEDATGGTAKRKRKRSVLGKLVVNSNCTLANIFVFQGV